MAKNCQACREEELKSEILTIFQGIAEDELKKMPVGCRKCRALLSIIAITRNILSLHFS
jgi:hypothetical protein